MTLAVVNARHARLDSRMRVIGSEPILSFQQWKEARILLGAAVLAVVKYLQLNPLEIIEITDAGLRAIQPPKTRQNHNQTNSNDAQQHERTSSRTSNNSRPAPSSLDAVPPLYQSLRLVPERDMPHIPSRFKQLDSLLREQIDNLLEDQVEFTLYSKKLPIIQTCHKYFMTVIDENVTHADHFFLRTMKGTTFARHSIPRTITDAGHGISNVGSHTG
jgi:hypothetical protein